MIVFFGMEEEEEENLKYFLQAHGPKVVVVVAATVTYAKQRCNKTNDSFGFRCHSIIAYLNVQNICL